MFMMHSKYTKNRVNLRCTYVCVHNNKICRIRSKKFIPQKEGRGFNFASRACFLSKEGSSLCPNSSPWQGQVELIKRHPKDEHTLLPKDSYPW